MAVEHEGLLKERKQGAHVDNRPAAWEGRGAMWSPVEAATKDV